MVFCSKCGNKCEDDAGKCPKCGTVLMSAENLETVLEASRTIKEMEKEAEADIEKEKKDKVKAEWIVVIVGIVIYVAALILITYLFISNNGMSDTLGQIRNGGIKDAIGGIIFLFTMLPLLFAGIPAGFLATTKIRESNPMVVLKCFVPIGTMIWFGLVVELSMICGMLALPYYIIKRIVIIVKEKKAS